MRIKRTTKRIAAMVSLLLMTAISFPSLISAAEPINVAGVYECDAKPNGVRKQMYLTLDFIKGTPDFTQVFSTKESSFKKLPKDFMNAKKLSTNFKGATAPGFGKYKEKYLFSNTDEFKLTNPREADGVITADWTTARGAKGECQIVVYPDRRLRIIGLTDLPKDLGPDDIEVSLVEDRLPQGATPFISSPDAIAFLVEEYEKSRVTPKVTTFDPEIETQVVKAEQKGGSIEVKMRMRNMSQYDELNIIVGEQSEDRTYAETKDGSVYRKFRPKTPGSVGDKPAVRAKKGEWVNFSIIFDGIDKKVDYLDKVAFDNYLAGGFFMDNHITTIENLPVFQTRAKTAQ